MALKAKLELRQGQSLVMTPQLQQAIRLLQMSNLELVQFVDTQLERNPLLEQDDGGVGDSGDNANLAADEDGGQDGFSDEIGDPAHVGERLEALDTDFDNIYSDEARADSDARSLSAGTGDGGWTSLTSSRSRSHEGDVNIEATLSREATLTEHLTEQLAVSLTDPAERLIGHYLIGMVNDAGYLAADVVTIAETLGASPEAVEATLHKLQEFDPPGVFARNLRECLAIQLKEQGALDPAMSALLDHLDLLAMRDFAALRQLCAVDMETLKEMIVTLRRLNPKPGNAFGAVVVQPVVPDVFVRPAQDNSWLVELNAETLPRVLVNNQYHAKVSRTAAREEDKLYLSECLANANWLVKSLEQRARTILKVAREIVRQQDPFLVYGVQHLRPLNLRTVAVAIGMHESTVSRVTANKYMATPRGIFEMKFFFTTAIASAEGGESHSAEAVRHRIKDLIDHETAMSVLSDEQIVELLREAGIDIARRTVAKYREALGIPSSVQRRREKQAYA